MELSPLILSLEIAFVATAITFFLGVAVAWFVAGMRRFQGLADAVLTLPMVLPPTVVGFFLLLLFGRNSPLGQLLLRFDFSFVFTKEAAVAAAVVVSLPLLYRTARGAFEQIDPNILAAARTLGASEARIFWRVALPNARGGIMAGTILAFTRALGEFGATMMVAGNIPGRTQTMSTAIYAAVQAGDDAAALRWVVVVVLFSFVVVGLMNCWLGRRSGQQTGKAAKWRNGDASVR